MPEYTLASIALLAGSAVAAAWRGMLGRRSTWLGLAVFALATVVADIVLTGLPIVTYDPAMRSGVGIGPMPVEDLLYGVALYLVAVAAWGPSPVDVPATPTMAAAARAMR